MFGRGIEELKLTAKHKQLLQNLTIDDRHPGPIVHDFNKILNILNGSNQTLTAANQLPMQLLAEINVQLHNPIELGLKRPQQKSYPHIHGLYLLIRASGLSCIEETGKQPLLIIDEAGYQRWKSLNPVEQFGSLLEVWLLRGLPDIIGERARFMEIIPNNFHEAASFYASIPTNGLPVVGNNNEEWLKYSPGWHNLGLLDLFGLIQVERGASEVGRNWRIASIHRTPFGDALLAALYEGFFRNFSNIFQLEDEPEAITGTLQTVLKPFFPKWEHNLVFPEHEQTFRTGAHTFKVVLGSAWRRITIDAKQTLDDLAGIILESVNFDNDHLYEFAYRTRFGSTQKINHPYIEAGKFTSEIRVGDLQLQVGQKMNFLFDFGDQWEFDMLLEEVDPLKAVRKPIMLESHGEAPEQYPGLEDWEEWDEEDID